MKENMLHKLKQKIASKKAKIGVIGLGYVGLPLAVAFAKQGYAVTGIDTDKSKISALHRGESYISDVPARDLKAAVTKKLFKATADNQAIRQLDAVIICVPTPLSKTNEPDISFVIDAAKQIAKYLKRGQLVVLESTTYPGTTEEVLLPLLQKSKLKVETDFFLAFSPERVDPGNKQFDTVTIPKVVGGVGVHSTKAAVELYRAIIENVIPVSSSKTAEMAKLLENTFRSVNIALINEIAVMANHLGIDVWEVIEAAKTKPFGFMPFYPGPGIGGHCLPIDPLYLSWKSRIHGYEAKMIELAATVNKTMPRYVVERIGRLLNLKKTPLKGAQVLVLGVAYKRDVNDIRESPAIEVMDHLLEEGSMVSYSDPYCPKLDTGRTVLRSKSLTPELLKKQDCVVILTDHSRFNYPSILQHSRLILDTRNSLRKFSPKEHLFFL